MRKTTTLAIGITGLPGAGKSTAVNALKELSYPVVVMGDFVREVIRKRGLKPTPENLGKVMVDVRKRYGKAAVAKMTVNAVKNRQYRMLIIDGVRSPEEVEEFKKSFPRFRLIAINASPEERFRRLRSRERSDDAMDFKRFLERDNRELMVGVGRAMAIADRVISASSIEELKSVTVSVVESLLHED